MPVPSTSNPFGPSHPAVMNSAVGNALVQREVAEVQAQMLLARSMPRDEAASMDRILEACTRASVAEHALYQYARGGTDISGASIKLMESIAQRWGNLDWGWRELEQERGWSTIETWARDLESGATTRRTFRVQHARHTKQGSYPLTDPRDVYELLANQAARRVRACLLAVIPREVSDAAVDQCEITMKARETVSPERVADMLAKFAELGVTQEQIEARVQRKLEAITSPLMVQLGRIFNSIQDGMSKPADWFAMPEAAPSTSSQQDEDITREVDSGGGRISRSRRDNKRQAAVTTNPTPATTRAGQPDPATAGPVADASAAAAPKGPPAASVEGTNPASSPDLWETGRE